MPLPTLAAANNTNYGGDLVTQKYSPLVNITFTGAVAAEYQTLFTNRINALMALNVYPMGNPPIGLTFYTQAGLAPAVAVAPMIVISSGRANWIKSGLDNAAQHGPFTGYLDSTTFSKGLVPWYAPSRCNRNVYVIVHWTEFSYYQDRLGAVPDLKVVGYRFDANAPILDIVGFGATRFAALQFAMSQGFNRAWLVDDNVVNVNGFPNALATMEENMRVAPVSNVWAIGFNGATRIYTAEQIRTQALCRFQAAVYTFAQALPGLLQQVVYWNINLLRQNSINCSPLFVTSNEDVSLSNLLKIRNWTQKVITQISVVKVQATPDPSFGSDTNHGAAVEIPKRRNRMLQVIGQVEGDIQINGGAGTSALSDYILETVLEHAVIKDRALNFAQAQAIEQVLAAATGKGAAWYPLAAYQTPYSAAHAPQFQLAAQMPFLMTAS